MLIHYYPLLKHYETQKEVKEVLLLPNPPSNQKSHILTNIY